MIRSKEMDKEEGVAFSGWSGVGRPLTAAVVPTPSEVKHIHHLHQRDLSDEIHLNWKQATTVFPITADVEAPRIRKNKRRGLSQPQDRQREDQRLEKL